MNSNPRYVPYKKNEKSGCDTQKTIGEPRSRKLLLCSTYHKLNFSGTKFLITGIDTAYTEFRPVIYVGKMDKFGDGGLYLTEEEYESIFTHKNVTDEYFAGRDGNFGAVHLSNRYTIEFKSYFNERSIIFSVKEGQNSVDNSFNGKIIWQRSTWINFKNIQKTVCALLYLQRRRSANALSTYKKILQQSREKIQRNGIYEQVCVYRGDCDKYVHETIAELQRSNQYNCYYEPKEFDSVHEEKYVIAEIEALCMNNLINDSMISQKCADKMKKIQEGEEEKEDDEECEDAYDEEG